MKPPKGFTLLEFVLYIGLISIVFTGVVGFALDVVKSRTKAEVVAEVEDNSRLVLARVLRAVRRADSLNVASSTLEADSGVLTLNMSSTSTNPTVFDLSGGAVRITEDGGTATPLTTGEVTVSKLRFSRDNLAGGEVTVTAQIVTGYNNPGTDRTYSYTYSTSGTAMIRKQGS